MDRSFLTNAAIIQASRNFVCIRVATYENEAEAKFMKSLFTRSGELENTTFGMLAPDGKTKISRASRGPRGNPRTMAAEMVRMAEQYASTARPAVVPAMQAVDLALNVAACDNLPVAVVVAKDADQLKELEQRMASAVWSEEAAGQFVYARTTDPSDLRLFGRQKQEPGILLVRPGDFGLAGEVLNHIPADSSPDEIQKQLLQTAQSFDREKPNHNAHVSSGIALGLEWKTKLPETDAQSVRAKERAWGRAGR